MIFCQTHTLSSPESTTQHPPHHQYHQWFIMASFSSLMAKTRQRWQLLWAFCRLSVDWQCLSQTHWQTHCKLWIISWISWLLSWIGIGKVVKRWWYRVLFGLLAELNFVGDNDDIVIIVNIIIHIQTVALFTDIYNKKKLFTDMTLIPGSSLWQPTGHLSSLLHLGRLLLQVKHKGSADHRYKKH